MKSKDNDQIDSELNALLGPLKNAKAGDARLETWRAVVDEELARDRASGANEVTISFNRRVIEWVVAASIGFVVATAWMGFSQKESQADYFSGVDATEMHLVAKSD
jgi:hypothetical protein